MEVLYGIDICGITGKDPAADRYPFLCDGESNYNPGVLC